MISNTYQSIDYCPTDFEIPTVENYKSLVSELGNTAYSVLTNKNGFNMSPNVYYLTRNASKTTSYTFQFLYVENGKIKIGELNARKIDKNRINIKCIFNPPTKIIMNYNNNKRDITYNTTTTFSTTGQYFNGYLWRIDNKIYTTKTVSIRFEKSGIHRVQFWGNLLNDKIIYICELVFMKKKTATKTQIYNLDKIKVIQTDFSMSYLDSAYSFFFPGSSHVAPRINGGNYIGVGDINHYLHILSFDKNDKLIKDFNTSELAEIIDITSTDYGFAYYARDFNDINYHSYMKLYNKNFQLINSVEIMNNKKSDNISIASNINKQVIKYEGIWKASFWNGFYVWSN